VSELAAECFILRKTRTISATTRTRFGGVIAEGLYLHNNRIAWFDKFDVPWISFCGWPTFTTRDRLEAVARALRMDMDFQLLNVRRNGIPTTLVVNGIEHDSKEPIPLCGPLGALAFAAELQIIRKAA
jgi:hypothetical protein